MHSLDEYDSKARWYYPAICRTTTMDPLAEKYYPTKHQQTILKNDPNATIILNTINQ
jgi:hypothetical protein